MLQVLAKAVPALLTKVFMSLASEKMLEWFLFYVAEHIVKSTKTKHDDVFFEKVKEAYNEGGQKAE